MLLLLSLLACLPPSAHQVGLDLVAEGQTPEAVTYWLDAHDARDEDRSRHLDSAREHAADACSQLLDEAREHEAQGHMEEARRAYDRLEGFGDRLATYGVTGCLPDDLDDERGDVVAALASSHVQDGERALHDGDAARAIAAFEAALELVPGDRDATRELAGAHLGAGIGLVEERPAEALRHLERAAELGAGEAAHRWAAAVLEAQGRAYIHRGACRRAAQALTGATQHDPTAVRDELLAEARRCARLDLIPVPAEDMSATDERSIAFGPAFSDALESALRAEATDWVRLIDPVSPQAERARDPAEVAQRPGRTYWVRSRITQASVDAVPATAGERVAEGTTLILCDAEGTPWPQGNHTCPARAPVRYQESVEARVVRLVGSVRLTDALTGEQVLTAPLEVELRREARRAEAFTLVTSGAEAVVSDTPDLGVVALEPELLVLRQAPEPLPPVSRVRAEAAAALAQAAAAEVLAAVDLTRDPELGRLQVTPPVLDAGELEFAPAAPEVDPRAVDVERQPEEPDAVQVETGYGTRLIRVTEE